MHGERGVSHAGTNFLGYKAAAHPSGLRATPTPVTSRTGRYPAGPRHFPYHERSAFQS